MIDVPAAVEYRLRGISTEPFNFFSPVSLSLEDGCCVLTSTAFARGYPMVDANGSLIVKHKNAVNEEIDLHQMNWNNVQDECYRLRNSRYQINPL